MKNNFSAKALVLNPIVVILYIIFCSILLNFFEYGGTARRVPTLIVITGSLLVWFLVCLFFRKRIRKRALDQSDSFRKMSAYWFWFAVVSLIGMTVYTGFQTYQISQWWGTPLHRKIREWQTETTIDLEETDIISQGLDGLLAEIDAEIDLPEKLYAYSTVELEFNRNGDIESLYMPVVGENEEGLFESFLITSTSNTNQLTVLRNEPQDTYDTDEDWLLSPLVDTVDQLPISELIKEWPEEEIFGIYYAGYRTWGYNTEGIYYVEDNGPVALETANDEIIGYTVSLFVPGRTNDTTPMRFIDRSLSGPAESQARETEREVSLGYQLDDRQQEVYFLTEELGYRLTVTDAATGSRWYGLDRTADGGMTWETVNPDPFDGRSGESSGIVFFDEALGFFILSMRSQFEAILFRTDDAGEVVSAVEFPDPDVSMNDSEEDVSSPIPQLPYEENGSLFVRLYPNPTSEYMHDTYYLYQSDDAGTTWNFVEVIEGSED